jgi:hypothetical protein
MRVRRVLAGTNSSASSTTLTTAHWAMGMGL